VHSAGFTLVELSVVLIILTLLITGVLFAKDFIEASKLISVIREQQNWQTAITAFHTRYDDLPGDMIDATTYWSGANNGDGDGAIEWSVDSEGAQAWYQLEQAQAIPEYELTGEAASRIAYVWENVPGSDYRPDACWTINNDSNFGNYVHIGQETASTACEGSLFSPRQAKRLDEKVDDGIPNTGQVRGTYGTNPACGTSGAYAYSGAGGDTIACTMQFVITIGNTLQ
ncbi:MAG: prepilin-type N-terminal cleavage/methylation domain-containing protein, partial [Rickettsiales bacterium]|nr:prepilin-type N-terminal cleavage/methylation domain-containing protein [Rickettsiales bacterium]